MKEDKRQQMFHESLLKILYPPPPSPPPQEEEDEEKQNKLLDTLHNLPDELENGETEESPSSSEDKEGDNDGSVKLTRAQRKRLRRKKLKESASQRRKIIGPLLPGSVEDESDSSVVVVEDMPGSVRQNASTETDATTDPSEEPALSAPKQNKLKQRRKSKKMGGKDLNS